MRLRGCLEARLHAQVDGHGPAGEPDSAPARELRRLRDLAQAKDADVERPGGVLASGRHPELDVVDRGQERLIRRRPQDP